MNTPVKRCSRGGQCVHPDGCLLPATTEYFVRDSAKNAYGLSYMCKMCRSRHLKEKRIRNRGTNGAVQNDFKTCSICKIELPATPDYFHRNNEAVDRLQSRCKSCRSVEYKSNLVDNRLKCRLYYQQHSQSIKARVKRWQIDNRDKTARNWKAAVQKRHARKRDLPDGLTGADWQRALSYFSGCCAICNRPPGLWHTLAMDHWIPLSSPDCPGTTQENVIPLCHGIDGCNNSKHNKPAKQWLVSKFGRRKASEILARIEAYFECVTNQHESDSL